MKTFIFIALALFVLPVSASAQIRPLQSNVPVKKEVIQKQYTTPNIEHMADNDNSVTKSVQYAPVTVTTGKLTITGGGAPLSPPPSFPPVTIETGTLTITGGGIPLQPNLPFPGITITTTPLTISGKSN